MAHFTSAMLFALYMVVVILFSVWGKQVEGSFYIAHYPVRWTAQSALHFCLPWQTCSFRHQLGFSGSILARQQLCAKAKSPPFPPLSIARYSFIQLSEPGRQWRERWCPIFETGFEQRRIRTRAHWVLMWYERNVMYSVCIYVIQSC